MTDSCLPVARPLRVLVVDDDPQDCELIEAMLEASGLSCYRVESVSAYAEALQRMAAAEHDLYLIDYRLGARTGLDLLREPELAANERPKIVLTALRDHAVDHAAMEAGAVAYLVKGEFDALQLDRTIRYVLAQARRRQAEQRLREHARLESLAVLAGGVAHDFNNLLTIISGNAALLRRGLSDGSALLQPVEVIERVVRHAGELTNQMMAFAGLQRFIVEPLDANRLVREAVALCAPADGAGGKVLCELAPKLPPIEGDAASLRHVVLNLLNNACEAGEVVQVRVRTGVIDAESGYISACLPRGVAPPPGRYVYLEVADDGPGIASELVEHIFDPFYTTKFTGRGLGLAAVLGAVRGHGGAIRLETAPGNGTCFRVLLPAVDGAEAATQPAVVAAGPRHAGGDTVLLVEDEPLLRELGRSELELAGFHVIEAEDGATGLEAFRRHHPQLAAAVLDLMMPKMNGAELLCAMRGIDGRVPVVMISGYGEPEVLRRLGGQPPPEQFLHKPYVPEQLVAAVERAVERRR